MNNPTSRFNRVKDLLNTDILLLSIGDVAKVTNVSTRQLRYWEKKGYIKSEMSEKGQRKFTYFTLIKVGVIQSLIDEGYTLAAAVERTTSNDGVIHNLKHFVQERFNNATELDNGYQFDLGEVRGCDKSKHLFAMLMNDGDQYFEMKAIE